MKSRSRIITKEIFVRWLAFDVYKIKLVDEGWDECELKESAGNNFFWSFSSLYELTLDKESYNDV